MAQPARDPIYKISQDLS